MLDSLVVEDQGLTRDELIEKYREYVHAVAKRLSRLLELPKDEDEELISAGYLGLIEAASRYDSDSRVEFRQFAYFRIRGAMIDNLRKNSDLSPSAYRYSKALEAAQLTHEQVFQTPAEDDGIKKETLSRVLEYASQGALAFRLSCDSGKLEELLVADEQPERARIKGEERRMVRSMVECLPERERLIVEQYYFEDRTFREIRDQEGISSSWVSRLHARALSRLRNLLHEQELSDEV